MKCPPPGVPQSYACFARGVQRSRDAEYAFFAKVLRAVLGPPPPPVPPGPPVLDGVYAALMTLGKWTLILAFIGFGIYVQLGPERRRRFYAALVGPNPAGEPL